MTSGSSRNLRLLGGPWDGDVLQFQSWQTWSGGGPDKPTADCGPSGVRDTYHTDAISLVVVCNNGKVYEP